MLGTSVNITVVVSHKAVTCMICPDHKPIGLKSTWRSALSTFVLPDRASITIAVPKSYSLATLQRSRAVVAAASEDVGPARQRCDAATEGMAGHLQRASPVEFPAARPDRALSRDMPGAPIGM